MKYDWNDISIVPETLSSISSRKEINPNYDGNKLPLFTAPMDKVIDEKNINEFVKSGINICLPRNIKYENVRIDNYFYSYGLDEIIEIINSINLSDKKLILPKKVLIDVANGHMQKLWETSKLIKETWGDKVELMVGNIANPDTYRKYCEIGVDYIRVGIGGGSACTTSANVSIHYPMASLIEECDYIKKSFDNPTKIIADGGFRNFSDIIKALALGADYVMLGGIFNKCLESCGESFMKDENGQFYQVSEERAQKSFEGGATVYKYYRGMSTKEVQKTWNRSELKTGEGITKYNKVEYQLSGWVENFTDYLKSAMSYTDSRTLEDFIGEVKWEIISQNSFMRFNK
jgi:IMP dehydrogenase/GMP reductase